MIKHLLGYTCLVFFLFGCMNSKKEHATWHPIFNGQNLDGWTPKIKGYKLGDNHLNTFRVSDGVLEVNYDQYDKFEDKFGHLFYKTELSNYKLRLDYRFKGEQLPDGAGWATRNSGVMIHCQNPKTIELNQDFPVSVEVQLLGGLNQGDRPTGNVCTPGTNIFLEDKLNKVHCINSNSKTYDGDQWVHLEIEVRNDSIVSHRINGVEVFRYYKLQYGFGGVSLEDEDYWKSLEGQPLKKGYISLQSESHPVEFKNIELLELQ